MYQDFKRTCRAIVLLIKPFVWCRGLLKLPKGCCYWLNTYILPFTMFTLYLPFTMFTSSYFYCGCLPFVSKPIDLQFSFRLLFSRILNSAIFWKLRKLSPAKMSNNKVPQNLHVVHHFELKFPENSRSICFPTKNSGILYIQSQFYSAYVFQKLIDFYSDARDIWSACFSCWSLILCTKCWAFLKRYCFWAKDIFRSGV